MNQRLALVAARGYAEGPWMRARGNERQIRVRSLGEGETIVCELECLGVSLQSIILDRNDSFDLPSGWDRLRVIKHSEDDTICTHVDLMVE